MIGFLAGLAVLALFAAYIGAKKLRQGLLPPQHLWRSSLGSEMYSGELRYCYRCLDWAEDGTRCSGSKTACCGSGRS